MLLSLGMELAKSCYRSGSVLVQTGKLGTYGILIPKRPLKEYLLFRPVQNLSFQGTRSSLIIVT